MSLSARRTLAPVLVSALALLALAAAPAAAAPDPSPLSAQPSAQDFGLVPVESGEQSSSLSIQNTSAGTVLVGAATLDGAPAFRVSGDGCAGQLLGAGMRCNVDIGFDPSDGVGYAATLHVPTDGFEDLDVPLSGTGGVEQVTIAPASLDFGTLTVGDGAVRSFTLTNVGNLPFQSIVAIPTGGDVGAFRVERDGCSLQPVPAAASCEVAVRFAPSAAGTFDANLLLITGASQPAIVPLHGTGVAPVLAPSSPAATQPSAATEPSVADVAFAGPSGQPARFTHGRIDLGVARCASAARCSVVVHARVYALAPAAARTANRRGRGLTSARTDVVLWRLREHGRRVRLALPAGLRGAPALLVATLRTHARGQRIGVRTLVVPLVAHLPRRAVARRRY
jgi:hypothetical protein